MTPLDHSDLCVARDLFRDSLIGYRVNDAEYQAEIDYKYYHDSPDAFVSYSNDGLHYLGSTPSSFKGNNQEFDYHYLNASVLIVNAVDAVYAAEKRRIAWVQ